MTIFNPTLKEFHVSCGRFFEACGDKNLSQENITGLFKGMTLHYLNLRGISKEEIETAADMLQSMIQNATIRGWTLQ
jgi:hypothetical protein